MLFRDAAAIEHLRKVDTFIVDKTGTLTEGRPSVEQVIGAKGFEADEFLRLAAGLDGNHAAPATNAAPDTRDGSGTARSGNALSSRPRMPDRRVAAWGTATIAREGRCIVHLR